MKVIVAGATGLAGKAIVNACLADPRFTKVLILTRKAPASDIKSNPKSEIIMHQDFSSYPAELMEKLEGAAACLWAIGGRVDQFNNDKDMCRKVGVDYTLAAARAMCDSLADKTPDGTKFRFVFCSGKYSEWDPDKRLYFLGDSRRIKGEVEKGLCEIADKDERGKFETWIVRPSGLLEPGASVPMKLIGRLYSAIETPQLAKAMVKVACEGWKERIIENDVLLSM